MRSLLRPTLLVQAVWEIDAEALWGGGVRGLILDLDNTLVDWNQERVRPQVRAWLGAVRRRGMVLCLVSNALRGRRVLRMARAMGMSAVKLAGKPFPVAYRRAMAAMGTDARSTCAIGDQVFTDILGANWLGIKTVLVEPLARRESPHTRMIRLVERPLRRRWARLQARERHRLDQ